MMRYFGHFRPALSWLMAVVLMLPMLFAVLPSPVAAEEAALYRDLQASRCATQGMPAPTEHHDCDHCVLGAATHVPRVVGIADPLTEYVRLRVQTASVAFVFLHMDRARRAETVYPITGRGPPA